MKYVITLNGKRYEAEVSRTDDFTPLTRANATAAAPAAPIVMAAPAPVAAPAPAAAPAPVAAPAPAAAPAAASAGGTNVTSPMPGNILEVSCTVGQAVTAGQTLIVLEAMKMENEIVAPVAGTVAAINVRKGDTVETDAVLVSLS